MGSRYLTDLANVVRGAGLVCQEEPGWQYRARGSGGYDSGRPDHVMLHHTASGPSSDGQPDVNYCTYNDSDAPLCNLYLSRSGKVWVCAGGATNTNGSGTCPHCGLTDSMNSRAIGIEAGSTGSENWPTAQQDAYDRLVTALLGHYGIATEACQMHHTYAPSRKVDPSGPSRWSNPTGGGGSNMWRLDDFQASVGGGSPSPGPGPSKKGDEVAICIQAPDGTDQQRFATFALQPGCRIGWLTSQTQIDVGKITGTLEFQSDGTPLKNFKVAEIQDMINRYWAGGPKPPGYQ